MIKILGNFNIGQQWMSHRTLACATESVMSYGMSIIIKSSLQCSKYYATKYNYYEKSETSEAL